MRQVRPTSVIRHLIAVSVLIASFTTTFLATPGITLTNSTANVSAFRASVIVLEEKARVRIAIAKVRREPSVKSESVGTLKKGAVVIVEEAKAPWYRISTDTIEGWVHGSSIVLLTPTQTKKRTSSGPSPFESNYTGSEDTEVTVYNDAGMSISLKFGGVRYSIPAGGTETISAKGGNYEYFASAAGVRPLSGVKTFRSGYSYSWRFYVSTRYW